VRIANSISTLLPLAEPYTLSMDYAGGKVSLAGSLPGEDSRKGLIGALAAALPGATVDDKATLARGAPSGFDALAGFAAAQLGSLASGSAQLAGTDLSITGTARTAESFEAIRAALASEIPGGGAIANAVISPPAVPAYTFGAARSGGEISLTGFIPEEGLRGVLLEAARSALPGGTVKDMLQLGSGAPDAFPALARFAVDSLASLNAGSVQLDGAEFSITGEAASEAGMAAITQAVAGAISAGGKLALLDLKPAPKPNEAPKPEPEPQPVKVVEEPAPAPEPAEPVNVPAEDCQKKLDETIAGETIQFVTGAATISDVSLPLLDRLSAAAIACLTARIEISGHTDADGSDADNMRLSQDRARAVAAYITMRGVDAGRLEAKGFGESKPVADNESPEGKAKNRRIEFRVLN
jgi:OOP family OmpA-OmpF porin